MDDKLETLQNQINKMLRTYDTTLSSYVLNVENKNTQQSNKDLKALRKINTNLIELVTKGKNMMSEYTNQNGETTPKLVLFDAELRKITSKLNAGESKITEIRQELHDIYGVNKVVTLKMDKNRMKYFFFALLVFVVLALTIRAFIVSDSNVIDNIILTSMILLVLYRVIVK